jgi:type I restriction enzyme S subunit
LKTNLQKHPTYKPSGVEWIGEIPEHWEVKRIKHLFKEINERSIKGNEELLSVSQYTGVTKKSDKIDDGGLLTTASTLEGYKKVFKGDLVSNIMLAWNGSLGISPFNGITSPAYSIYRLIGKNDKKYFHYLLRTEIYKAEFKRNSSGVIDSRLRLYSDDFFRIISILPPLSDQEAITNFLDHKTVLIDKAIGIKEKQIELLKEHRQILIHRAVTRGLDPNVKLKDSGVEWIGEIPEHWKIVSNRVLFKERNESGNEFLTILSVSIHTAVSSEELSDEDNIRGKIRIEDKRNYKLVMPNDIVYNMMRAWQGGIGAVRVNGMVSPAYVVAEPIGNIQADFFEYQYRTSCFIQQMDRNSKGITDFRKRLYWNEFKQLKTILPPLSEQKEIITYIETFTSKIATTISLKEKEIEKLKEYKSTLINSTVTGKTKVS